MGQKNNRKKECKNCEVKLGHHEHGHYHENEHEEEEETSLVSKILYVVSIVIFVLSFIPILEPYKIWMCLASVLLSGYKLFLEGIINIFKLNFEEDTLMTIAVIAAFALGDFPESCMVVLLFRLGEFLEDKAVEKSNKNINDIVNIKAKTANILNKDQSIKVVDVKEVKVGEIVLVKPGEMIPLDGEVLEGTSNLDTSNLTGESRTSLVKEGDQVLSGTVNLSGSLKVKVLKDEENSTVSQIVDLVYEATNNKGKTEEFITKFSKIYTPIVIFIALIIAFIVPFILKQDMTEWLSRALVFLVASCPCSIVISVPLAFFTCVGTISKKGMLVKGTKHIEALSKAKYICLDKTGTITTGKMEIKDFVMVGNIGQEEILGVLYALEKNSNHPISTAIIKEYEKCENKVIKTASNYEEIAGHGISAIIDEKKVLFGNEKLLKVNNINLQRDIEGASYLVVDNKVQVYITFKEELRKNTKELCENLKKVGIKEITLLTGDNKSNAEELSREIKIDNVYAGLLPNDKLQKLNEIKEKGKVIFVGDGINDGPVIASADFGIAMGEGTEIAGNTADGILISNNLNTIPEIMKIAKKSIRIIKYNIVFSLMIKAVVLTLGILGIAPIWLAVVADTGVSLITVINAITIRKNK